MKKLFSFLAILVLLFYCSSAFAAVGIRLNGTIVGQATDLNLTCGTGTNTAITSDGSIYNINCSSSLSEAGLANGGAVSTTSLVTAIPTGYAYVQHAMASDFPFTAGTLANGIPGQILTIEMAGPTQLGGVVTFNLFPVTSTAFSSIKFTAKGDTATLIYVNDTVGWILNSYDGSITVTTK